MKLTQHSHVAPFMDPYLSSGNKSQSREFSEIGSIRRLVGIGIGMVTTNSSFYSSIGDSNNRYPLLLWLLVIGALFGSVQFGYQQGVLNTAWPQLVQVFEYYDVNSWYTSVINFSYLIGATFGSLCAGGVADKYGPKKSLLINCFVFIAGGLISSFSMTGKIGVIVFSIGRFLAGIGAGATSLLSPRLIAEISPTNLRGALGTMTQLFICLGVVISYLAGLPYQTEGSQVPDWQWRLMILISIIFPITQIIILSMSPESPEWLAMKGYYDTMLWAEKCLYGDKFTSESESLLKTNDAKYQQVLEPVCFGELFSRKYRMFMSLGILTIVFQQASGINTVVMYSTTVYQQVNLENAVLASVVTGVINVLGTLVSTCLIEKAGRRVLTLISHFGMFLCLGYIMLLEWLPFPPNSQIGSYSAFVALLLYVMLFSIGVGPIGWLYLAEILPPRIKGKAAAIATSLNWTTVMIIVAAFPIMLKQFGTGASYGVFAVINLVAFVYLWFYMIETKQIPMEEIEKQLLLQDDGDSESESCKPIDPIV